MDFGAILAQFHKKLDVNSLFKLLIDLHFDMREYACHKKLKHEVCPSPTAVWLLLKVNWVL